MHTSLLAMRPRRIDGLLSLHAAASLAMLRAAPHGSGISKLLAFRQSAIRLEADQLQSDSPLVHSGPSLSLAHPTTSDRGRDRASVGKAPLMSPRLSCPASP